MAFASARTALTFDFPDYYMTSEMVMRVRGDEDRFEDAASAAQPDTTPFYVAGNDLPDADEASPRIQLFAPLGRNRLIASGGMSLFGQMKVEGCVKAAYVTFKGDIA